MNLLQNQLFEEFIQYAYNEMNISGWRDRMNELRGFETGHLYYYRQAPNGTNNQGLERLQMTIPELAEENGNFEETIMNIFKWDLFEHHWFKGWFKHYHNEIYITMSDEDQHKLGDGRSEIQCDFEEFIDDLSFEKMMEIIHSDNSLK